MQGLKGSVSDPGGLSVASANVVDETVREEKERTMRAIDIPAQSPTIDAALYDPLPPAPEGVDFLAYFDDGMLQMSVRLDGERIGKVYEASDGISFVSDRFDRPLTELDPVGDRLSEEDKDLAEEIEEYAVSVFARVDGEVYGLIVSVLGGDVLGKVLEEALTAP